MKEKGTENLIQPVRKALKNLFAKEVGGVLNRLHEKATELKKEIEENKKRDGESREEQKILNSNLCMLIDSQRTTNEMMQNWMNVSI